MEVALDGAHGAAQGLCQGLHLGPAEARLVVGVIGEGAVGGDRLGGDSSEDEGLDFRDTGKSGLLSHRRLLFLVRRCALMIEFTKAAGPRQKEIAPPLFLCSFYWCVLYLHGHPRASPTPSRLGSLSGSGLLFVITGRRKRIRQTPRCAEGG